MKVLVTGGAGFIGSHLCERALKKGYEVVCLDNFDPYYPPNLKRENVKPFLSNRKFKLVESSILDQRLVREVINQGVDYVFHCAAQAGVRVSVENPMKAHEVNATGTLNILQACVDSNVQRIINASSSSVYGEVAYLPFDEAHPNLPKSPYGVSKLMAEHYCRVFSQIHGLKITSLRLFTVYGPRMRPDLAISIFVERALRNEPIEIFGDGSKTRDFTYIDDVVEAYLLTMKQGEGEAYNIGSGNRISVLELARMVIELTGSRSEIHYTEPQQGDAEHTWASVGKAGEKLGWSPKIKIEPGLQKFIEVKKHDLGL
jgi:UDP-glucose 4-epimerase